jgi:hypothetical protein
VEVLLELPHGRVVEIHCVVVGVRPERRAPIALPGMELRLLSMSKEHAAIFHAWLESVSIDFWAATPPTAVDA